MISRNEDDDLEQALKRFEINCQAASDLRSEKLVLHLWSGIPSDQKIENN